MSFRLNPALRSLERSSPCDRRDFTGFRAGFLAPASTIRSDKQIVRTEQPTGTENRARREEIVPLLTGTREAEPEMYLDCSESEGWAWESNPAASTWDIQLEAVRNFIAPFEVLDSQAAEEQSAGGDEKGGIYCYPFSNIFQPIGHGADDGDLNSANFDRKIGDFIKKYSDAQASPAAAPRS